MIITASYTFDGDEDDVEGALYALRRFVQTNKKVRRVNQGDATLEQMSPDEVTRERLPHDPH